MSSWILGKLQKDPIILFSTVASLQHHHIIVGVIKNSKSEKARLKSGRSLLTIEKDKKSF